MSIVGFWGDLVDLWVAVTHSLYCEVLTSSVLLSVLDPSSDSLLTSSFLLLVEHSEATKSSDALVTSSFLLLVEHSEATKSSDALVTSSFLILVEHSRTFISY